MSDSVYSVIAYIARYWFAFLVVIILWRAIIWLQKDAGQKARVQSRLPDAGHIGEWAVLESAGEMPEGMTLAATRDGWMGSARGSDLRIRGEGIPARAARFFLRRDGLHLQPHGKSVIEVDGEQVQHQAVLRHGATVTIAGIVTIQLRLFAGILLEGETIIRRKKPQPLQQDLYNEEIDTHLPDMLLPGGIQLPLPFMVVDKKTITRIRRRYRGTKTTRWEYDEER